MHVPDERKRKNKQVFPNLAIATRFRKNGLTGIRTRVTCMTSRDTKALYYQPFLSIGHQLLFSWWFLKEPSFHPCSKRTTSSLSCSHASSDKFFNMSTKLNCNQKLEVFTCSVLKTCLSLIWSARACVRKLPSVSKGEAIVENKFFLFHLKTECKTKESNLKKSEKFICFCR